MQGARVQRILQKRSQKFQRDRLFKKLHQIMMTWLVKRKYISVIIHVVNLVCHSLWPAAFKEPKLRKWERLTKFLRLQYQQPIA